MDGQSDFRREGLVEVLFSATVNRSEMNERVSQAGRKHPYRTMTHISALVGVWLASSHDVLTPYSLLAKSVRSGKPSAELSPEVVRAKVGNTACWRKGRVLLNNCFQEAKKKELACCFKPLATFSAKQ